MPISELLRPTTAPAGQTAPMVLHSPKALAVSVDEAAEMLGVHVNTVRREIKRGRLGAVHIGRVFRVRVAEVHSYLRRNEVNHGPEQGRLGD